MSLCPHISMLPSPTSSASAHTSCFWAEPSLGEVYLSLPCICPCLESHSALFLHITNILVIWHHGDYVVSFQFVTKLVPHPRIILISTTLSFYLKHTHLHNTQHVYLVFDMGVLAADSIPPSPQSQFSNTTQGLLADKRWTVQAVIVKDVKLPVEELAFS